MDQESVTEQIAERAGATTEEIVEGAIEHAEAAIAAAEERAEIAEAITEAVIEAAVESEEARALEERFGALWNRLNEVAADLARIPALEVEIATLQSNLTALALTQAATKQPPAPENSSSTLPPSSAEVEAAIADPLATSLEVPGAEESPAPALPPKRRRVI